MGGTKLERFLPKNQHTERKFLNFENWVNGEVSKIISFEYVDAYAKIFLILYPPLEYSTSRIAIVKVIGWNPDYPLKYSLL